MTNECEICGMDCGVEPICEQCLQEIEDGDYYEPDIDEAQEWYDFDPDC